MLNVLTGDTPTAGAGFWAEQYLQTKGTRSLICPPVVATALKSLPMQWLPSAILDCLPTTTSSSIYPTPGSSQTLKCAVAMSGTGNGDSFLRLSAVRTCAARAQSDSSTHGSLTRAVRLMSGPQGELQRSAQGRWGDSGEGEGGIIGNYIARNQSRPKAIGHEAKSATGIQLIGDEVQIVSDFNCGGMLRCWTDDSGVQRCMVFRDDY